MYEYSEVINAVVKFIDEEILIKITGWQKWAIGAGAGVLLSKSSPAFNKLKENDLIKAMGIINKDDKINIDLLYKELKKQAQKSAVTFEVPLIGAMTLNEQDLDKLYQFIKK